jgi:RHS repeat-associated protein
MKRSGVDHAKIRYRDPDDGQRPMRPVTFGRLMGDEVVSRSGWSGSEEAMYVAITRAWCRLGSREERRVHPLDYVLGAGFVGSVARAPVDWRLVAVVCAKLASRYPWERDSGTGTVTYLHHDQQGSTRLLTGSTGTVTGSTTFDAYGNKTGSTGTSTTPLGYDGQYTSSDTGLIYLRARVYDPATAQFLSRDPLAPITRALYTYTKDNPVNYVDLSGRAEQVCAGGAVSFWYITVEVNRCYVNTPGGEGGTISGGLSFGPGVGANLHVGAGGSNAQTPGEYDGPFGNWGGSVTPGIGGFVQGFAGPGECNPIVAGGNGGITVGSGTEVGGGGSITFPAPIVGPDPVVVGF